jgi:hypothetical protein
MGLQVNARKSSFCIIEMEYLGYILMCMGIKPQSKKVKAILAISPSQQVKDLRKFLGTVQYYQDLLVRLNNMLAPHTSLVGECGHTKVTKANKTKKCPWYWDVAHQKAFNDTKATIARDIVLNILIIH